MTETIGRNVVAISGLTPPRALLRDADGFRAEAILRDADRPIPIMTAEAATTALQAVERVLDNTPSQDDAQRAATRFLMSWPRKGDVEPEVYLLMVTDLFLDYPIAVVDACISVKDGLPGKLKWFPAISEVKAELDAYFGRLTAMADGLRRVKAKAETADQRRVGNIVADTIEGAEQIRKRPEGPFHSRVYHEIRNAVGEKCEDGAPRKKPPIKLDDRERARWRKMLADELRAERRRKRQERDAAPVIQHQEAAE